MSEIGEPLREIQIEPKEIPQENPAEREPKPGRMPKPARPKPIPAEV